ncbi:hypothetical protein SNE40_011837 [Patella caerulea]|uniref:BLOC-2 complex member HPS6 C-terminal domain-containing protein n=2 Tax=Patella caerulea TaxID=87958 RepID=A0AAN8PPU4_PATCE
MCILCNNIKTRKLKLTKSDDCVAEFLRNVDFEVKPSISCFPLSRKDKLSEVIKHGGIGKSLLAAGHVFITTNKEKHLLTFDCKPAHLQQFEDTVFLDLLDIKSEVVDVVVSNLYSKTVLIVFSNGILQVWKYSGERQVWSGVHQVHITSTKTSEVISFCVQDDHSAIYWCERNDGVYNVCKRGLPKDLEELEERSVGKLEIILSHCPEADIFQMRDYLCIVARHTRSRVHITILWRPSTDHVTVFIGGEKMRIDNYWTNHMLDFRNIILHCMSVISQMCLPCCDAVTIYDSVLEELVVVYNDGTVYIFHVEQEKVGSVAITSFHLPSDLKINKNNCFLSNGFLGISNQNYIRLYSLHIGQLLKVIQSPDRTEIDGTLRSINPVFIGGFFTQSESYVIQKCVRRDQLVACLSKSSSFQTKGLQYAQLSQKRLNGKESIKTLKELRESWDKDKIEQPRSQLTHIIEPFIKEFWRLEDLSEKEKIEDVNRNGTHKDKQEVDIEVLESEINKILSGSLNLPSSWQQSQLLILSEKYPEPVLDILSRSLNLDEESVSETEMFKWRKVLGLGETDAGNQKPFIFNHLCRLIFKLRPELLVKFVEMSQIVSEKYIGVSAFVRKRHIMQYYQKALDCLPEPNTSVKPQIAINSTSKLLLACGDKNSILRTVRYLVSHQQWKKIFRLLEEEEIAVKQRSMFIYILVTALVKNGVLTDYTDQLSSLIPNWQKCPDIESIINGTSDDKIETCLDSGDFPAIASIQPLLQDLFK